VLGQFPLRSRQREGQAHFPTAMLNFPTFIFHSVSIRIAFHSSIQNVIVLSTIYLDGIDASKQHLSWVFYVLLQKKTH
jgi:hypothetical protein